MLNRFVEVAPGPLGPTGEHRHRPQSDGRDRRLRIEALQHLEGGCRLVQPSYLGEAESHLHVAELFLRPQGDCVAVLTDRLRASPLVLQRFAKHQTRSPMIGRLLHRFHPKRHGMCPDGIAHERSAAER